MLVHILEKSLACVKYAPEYVYVAFIWPNKLRRSKLIGVRRSLSPIQAPSPDIVVLGLSGVSLRKFTVNLRSVNESKSTLPRLFTDPDLYVKLAVKRGFDEKEE
jgi:hypothetical protein